MATLIQKAFGRVTKASRGSLSSFVLNAPHQYGQPLPMQGDAAGLITQARMREIVLKTPTAAASMNAILDFAPGVKIKIRNTDPSQPADDLRVRRVTSILRQPNPQENWRRFAVKLIRDLFTLGYAAIEIEPGKNGAPVANLWVLDAGKIYVDYDEHGGILGYDMLDAHGVPIPGPDKVHAWMPDEVIWLELNPQSNSLYPSSRVQQLFVLGVLEDLMIAYIAGRFTDTNVPYGVFDMGDLTDGELKTAIASWNKQANNSQHRIMLTGSKGSGLKWFPFNYQLKELDASNLLNTVRSRIMGIVGVTMNELGESADINKANGYNLSYTFKKRAIEPILDELVETLTARLLWQTLGMHDLELYYEEIDSRDELLQAQIDEVYFKGGVWSVNDIRNRKGLPSVPGGDILVVFTGSAFIPVDTIQAFSQAQLLSLLAIDAATLAAIQEANGGDAGFLGKLASAPMTRVMQEPERYTTPDAPGSSTEKLKLPRPNELKPPTPVSAPQKPRGKVAASRSQGQRKEAL